MNLHLDIIQSTSELERLCGLLIEQTAMDPYLAVDTEFIRERTYYPELALIQIATGSDAWLVDPLPFAPEQMAPLLKVINDPQVLKFLHSAQGDQECFFFAYEQTIINTLDTFEAASLTGLGESVSLRDLVYRITGTQIPKYLTRTNWLKRPMGKEMRRYAMSDVEHLVRVGKELKNRLEELKRLDWARELSKVYENPKQYLPSPETMARRIGKSGRVHSKNYGVFLNLVQWREERAQRLNLPRRRIADDDTLVNLANARPKTIESIKKFRGIQKAEVERRGKELLRIFQGNGQVATPPKMPRFSKPNPQQARVIDFLGTFLKTICQENKIASRLVLTVKELQRIVVDNLYEPEQWVEAGLCSSAAAQLVGKPIQSVLAGHKGLGIQSGKLTVLDLGK